MQTFKTRFTTDVSQHRRAMGEFRQQTTSAVQQARNSLLALGALSLGGIGLKEVIGSTISLAAEMEKTEVAFEVMLGSAEKAKAVLGDLTRFADITPFDTAEIIAAGRGLMACGVATTQLSDRLTLLGNIAAGTNMKIGDMVALYAKMANKGKVQTEELNQMAERGIPIYKLLCDMLGVTQGELSKMGESGQLSFALISEALEKLGGKGGMYFGLIEKQSQTLSGLWNTLAGNVKMLQTEFGKMIIPELSQYLDQVIKKLDEMKKSGELASYMRRLSDTLISLLRATVNLAEFLARNQDTLLASGKILLTYYAWSKVNGALQNTGTLLSALSRTNMSVPGLTAIAPEVTKVTTSMRMLARVGNGLKVALGGIAAAGATAFAGWEIGKMIGEALKLEDVFTRLLLKAKGKTDIEIDAELSKNKNKKMDTGAPDLADSKKRRGAINAELTKLRDDLANIDKSNTPGKDKLSAAVKAKIDQLEAEDKALDNAVTKYEARIAAEQKRLKEILKDKMSGKKDQDDAEKKVNEAKNEYEKANITFGARDQFNPDAYHLNNGQPPPVEAIATGNDAANRREAEKKLQEARGNLKQVKERNAALIVEEDRLLKIQKEYRDNKAKQDQQEIQDTLASATKLSAAERAKAERKKEAAKKIAETQKKIAEEQKKASKAQQDLGDEQYRDAMARKIEGWRDEIEKYQKDIDKTEKMLQQFGQSVDEDIIKTPEQIAQQKKDDLLRVKIEAANKGQSVSFTAEEKERINQLQEQQKEARRLKKAKETNEQSIKSSEKNVNDLDRTRKKEEWQERAKELKSRGGALTEAEKQINAAKEANVPLEKALKAIEEILKKGLPDQTV